MSIFKDLGFKSQNGVLTVPDTQLLQSMSVTDLENSIYNALNFTADAQVIIPKASLPYVVKQDLLQTRWKKYQLVATNPSTDIIVNGELQTIESTTINDSYYATLLMNCNDFTDATGKNTITNKGNVLVDTTIKKYGTGSLHFNGSNYLESQADTNSYFNWYAQDYTIEAWINNTSNRVSSPNSTSLQISYGVANSSTVFWSFGTNGAGNLHFYYFNGSPSYFSGGSAIPLNTWTHIALSYIKSTNTIIGFVNGVIVFNAKVSGTPRYATSNFLHLGLSQSTKYKGYMDDIRITKGLARYTANFTPPTSELTSSQIVTYNPVFSGTRELDISGSADSITVNTWM